MSACYPGFTHRTKGGKLEKNLCAVHCYEGDPEDRIKHLEKENERLRSQNGELNSRLMTFGWIERALNRGELADAVHAQTYWLQEKIWKQRRAINHLQRATGKWQPDYIIRELEQPGDLLIQEAA